MLWSGLGRTAVAVTGSLLGLTGLAGAQPTGVDNQALVDADATAEVVERATTISEQLFTYSYTDLAGHKRIFNSLTTGDLAKEYAKVFGSIEEDVVAQKVTARSKVAEAAVRTLTDSEAEVLVFLDLSSVRADTEADSQEGAMFLASLRRDGKEWKMSELNLFEDK